MNYEERMRLIAGNVNRFLAEWKRPEHLTNETAMLRLRSIAEAVNKRLPASLSSEALANVCGDIFQAVSESQRGKEWPDVSLFAKCAEAKGAAEAMAKPTTTKLEPVEINKARISAGEAVGDEWLYGRRAIELLKAGLSERDLEAHRSGLFFAYKASSGDEIARRMEMQLRRRHDDALEGEGMARVFGTVRELV